MDGPIDDEVKLNIRSVDSLFRFSANIDSFARESRFDSNPVVVEALDTYAELVGEPNKHRLDKLKNLENHLYNIGFKFIELFDEYKILYNNIYDQYSKIIEEDVKFVVLKKSKLSRKRKLQSTNGI